MTIYEKINAVKLALLEEGMKKGGKNGFSGYTYFQLADFMPTIIKKSAEVGLYTYCSCDDEKMTLTIGDANKEGTEIKVYTPTSHATLKGCHEVQNLGAVQTYLRRYLYMLAFDIIESDAIEEQTGDKDNPPQKVDYTISPKSGKKWADATTEELTAVLESMRKNPKRYEGYIVAITSVINSRMMKGEAAAKEKEIDFGILEGGSNERG